MIARALGLRVLSSLLLVSVAACDPPGDSRPPVAPTASPDATGSAAAPAPAGPVELAPAPFTSAQIRDATRPGRTYVWRVEAAGKPAVKRRIAFLRADPDRAEMEVSMADDEGKELEKPAVRQVTWDELRKHGEFPKASLAIREETLQVPAGTFECWAYTVVEGDEATTYYFAKRLPGAPVYFFTDKAGQRVMTSTLMEHRPGW